MLPLRPLRRLVRAVKMPEHPMHPSVPACSSETQAAAIGAHNGSCRHPVWQAVRASSAASFYLEDFRWVVLNLPED